MAKNTPFKLVQDTILKPAMVRAILTGDKRETRRLLTPSNVRIANDAGQLSTVKQSWLDLLFRRRVGTTVDDAGIWSWHIGGDGKPIPVQAALKWRAGGTIRVLENFTNWRWRDHWVTEYEASPDLLYIRTEAGRMIVSTDVQRPPFPPMRRPSIFLPRERSRLLLPITEVRIERLCDITEQGVRREGGTPRIVTMPNGEQEQLWSMDWSEVGEWRRFPSPRGRDLVHESDVGHFSAVLAFGAYINQLNGPDTWTSNPVVAVVRFRVPD